MSEDAAFPVDLLEAIGGRSKIKAVVPRLDVLLLMDPVLHPAFHGVELGRLACQQVDYLEMLFGAPPIRRPRTPDLRRAHKRLNLTGDQFARYLVHLRRALTDEQIPPELIEQIVVRVASLREHIVGPSGDAGTDEAGL
jgi:hemoglobin